jgi:hypothetical protein
MPAALGLAVAINASWASDSFNGRMADFDAEMQGAVRGLVRPVVEITAIGSGLLVI